MYSSESKWILAPSPFELDQYFYVLSWDFFYNYIKTQGVK